MLVQGVSNALRAWRAASSGVQVETGVSAEIGPQMLGTPLEPAVNDFTWPHDILHYFTTRN